jgi:polyhydroxyalkanoate synthesis regulator phasin
MQSYEEIRDQILVLRGMFEKEREVDSRMWEQVVEAIDEGELKGWLGNSNAEDLRERLSELEREIKALENY